MKELRKQLATILRRSQPRGYHVDDYKRWFPKTAHTFLEQLTSSGALPVRPEPTRDAIGVVVSPWVSTPTPWFAIMLGIGLAHRGRRIVFIWDDTGFPEEHLDEQNRAIGTVLAYVEQFLPVIRLSDQAPGAVSTADAGLVGDLAAHNVIWSLRGGQPAKEREQQLKATIRSSLGRSLPLVRKAFDGLDLDCVVVPGGVYGTSGLFLHEATARGIRVATFDTDRGIPQVCVDGIAAQNADIPRAFDTVWQSGEETRRRAIELAVAEFQSRIENRDGYGFQTLPASGARSESEGTVLIPLNVEWDTAALGRHVAFDDTLDWITSTISVILERDCGPVIVRQHPSERRRLQRSRLDIASVLEDRFGSDPRCRFVAADDPVNTYDLLRSARLVLPYVSTIAIEAAAMGKPVLMSGASYFAGLGFVWSPTSRDEYIRLLHRGLDGELELLPDQIDRAWICYYLAAVQNRMTSTFTSHPDDFWTWSRQTPQAVFAQPEVRDILEAIDCNVPMSVLRHRRTPAMSGGRG